MKGVFWYIILGLLALVCALWFTKTIWESGLPTWLKIFILR